MVNQCKKGFRMKDGKCKKSKSKLTIFLSIGIILALVIGIFVGNLFFSKTKIISVPADSGEFCFNKDPTFSSANDVSVLPSDWTLFVVGKDVSPIDSQLCLNVNPEKSECHIVDICPNCVTSKISCVCKD